MTPADRHLRCYFHTRALDGLGPFEQGAMAAIAEAGYDGVQFRNPIPGKELDEALTLGLGVCGSGRVCTPADAMLLAADARLAGMECVTLDVGWGLEDDDEAVRLIEAVLNASVKHSIPLYADTHRATLFQDMWRAVSFHRRFPSLDFNGDFSHWYTGQSMVYGGFEKKLAFIQPILGCVRFLHGRIGNSGSVQIDVEDGDVKRCPPVEHFRTLWKIVFRRYLEADTTKQEFITFTTELLAPSIDYARIFQGKEETDRWQQSLVLREIAKDCFDEVKSELGRPTANFVKRARRTA